MASHSEIAHFNEFILQIERRLTELGRLRELMTADARRDETDGRRQDSRKMGRGRTQPNNRRATAADWEQGK
jgi:hypothetical protein